MKSNLKKIRLYSQWEVLENFCTCYNLIDYFYGILCAFYDVRIIIGTKKGKNLDLTGRTKGGWLLPLPRWKIYAGGRRSE